MTHLTTVHVRRHTVHPAPAQTLTQTSEAATFSWVDAPASPSCFLYLVQGWLQKCYQLEVTAASRRLQLCTKIVLAQKHLNNKIIYKDEKIIIT